MGIFREGHTFVCLTCGVQFDNVWGNSARPINTYDPAFADREVCSDCNALYVVPLRLGQPVSAGLYDEKGRKIGTFSVGR